MPGRHMHFTMIVTVILAGSLVQPLMAARPIDDQLHECESIAIDAAVFLVEAARGSYKLSLGGSDVELELEEYSLFTDDVRAYRYDSDSRIEIPHSAPRTFRGSVRDFPGSYLNLTVCRDLSWVRGFVVFDDHSYYIQPRFEETPLSGRSELVVYEPHQVKEMSGTCGTVDSEAPVLEHDWSRRDGPSRSNLWIVPMVDNQYVSINPATWVDRMTSLISSSHTLFFTQNVVAFVMEEYGIFTASGSHDLNVVLQAMQYNLRKNFERRQHVVHLLSGKEFIGEDIGMAPGGANIARCNGYSVIQCVNDIAYTATDYNMMLVSCHELGHNFGSTHDQAQQGAHWNILCGFVGYTVMSENWVDHCMLNYFSPANISSMQNYLGVLDHGHPGTCNFSIKDGATYTTNRVVDAGGSANSFYIDLHRRGSFAVSTSDVTGLDLVCCNTVRVGDTVTLPSGDGVKTVYLYAYDANENDLSATDTIILDTTPPSSISTLASPSHVVGESSDHRSVDVTWQAATDVTAGVAGYSILWSENPLAEPDNEVDLGVDVLAATSVELADGSWYFCILAQDNAGLNGFVSRIGPFVITPPVGVDHGAGNVPSRVVLLNNYPDPFNPSTTLKFGLPQDGQVSLCIYDATGKLVRTLLDEHRAAGYHTVAWNGRNDRGQTVVSGTYLYRLLAAGVAESSKMALVR